MAKMTSPARKRSNSRDPRHAKIRSNNTNGISAANAARSVASKKIKLSAGNPIEIDVYCDSSIPTDRA